MVQILTYEHVENFRRARKSRDPQLIEPFLDDHVDWLVTGPVELLHFCGQRLGKAEVLDSLTRQHTEVLSTFKVELDLLLVDGNRTASLGRMIGTHRKTGRIISYSHAQFMRFCDGKIVEYRGIIDSFNAAEQMIGHAIELPESLRVPSAGDLIAI
jgi:ketosteroid isomerase-like protein